MTKYPKPQEPNAITFAIDGKAVLVLQPNGIIEWTLHDKKILITDQRLLCVALMDVVLHLSGISANLGQQIAPELWAEYQRIVASEKIDK